MEKYFCYENSDKLVEAVDVKPLDGYSLLVSFSNGETRVCNIEPRLEKPVFLPLKNKLLFSEVSIRHGTIFWDYKKGIDLCASVLYWESEKTEKIQQRFENKMETLK
jgi:hypothetical protein